MIDNTALLSELYNIQESYSIIEADIDQTIKRCIVNVKERTINIPAEIECLGVQYDHRSYRLFFEIDRYIHGVDLLTQTCVIQWLSKNGTTERSGLHPIVEIEAIDNDKLLFVWELYEDETRIPGTILFAVNFYSMKDENSFLWSYNTLPAQSIIQDTLDVVITPSEEITPSLLMVWNDKMVNIERLAYDSVSTSIRSAQEAEAWAHGRVDFPNTVLDNAKYYKELTQALYDDARDEVSNEKTDAINVITETSEAEMDRFNVAKQEAIDELERKVQEVTDSIPPDYIELEEAVNNKVPFPTDASGNNNYGSIDQILCSNGYGGTRWVNSIKDFERVEFDTETRYLRFLDTNGNDVYDPVYIEGGGGGGSSTASVVKLTNNLDSTMMNIASGDSVSVSFTFTSLDEGVPTGDGICQLIVNGITQTTSSIPQGTTTIDVTKYLTTGSNTVRIKCSDIYGNYKLLNYTVSVIDLKITSIFDDTVAYSDVIPFKFTLFGELEKTVHIVLDGTEIYTNTTTLTNRQTTVNLNVSEHGIHTLDAYVTATLDEKDLESDHLTYDIMFVEEGAKDILIASVYSAETVSQGTQISIPYSVYNPATLISEATLIVTNNGEVDSSQTIEVDRSRQYWNIRNYPVGETTFTIKCGDVTKSHVVNVTDAEIHVEPITNDMELYLSSVGRTNNELTPNAWTYNDVTTTFENVNWSSTGWIKDANGDSVLHLAGGATAEIAFKPFKDDWKAYGKTIEIEFAIRDVNNRDAVVISCMDENIGFEFTADTAILKSQQSLISCNYCDEERVKVTFVVESKSEYRLMQIYMNGIISGTIQYPTSDIFQQTNPVNISIGSEYCGVDIYTIRSYTNALTFTEVIDNYIYDIPDVGEKVAVYEENDIYNDYGVLQYSLIKNKIPVMTIVGSLPQSKGDKKDVKIIFEHNLDSSLNYEDTAEIDVQGTSSQFYIRKNYKAETSAPHTHAKGHIPSVVFCTKADYAESTGTHNTQNANLVETLYTEKTPAQLRDSRCRTTIYGYPIVIFHQETENSTPVFIGKYNYNDDKGSEEVFGFDGSFDVESWEFKNNTSDQCNFLAEVTAENWSENFEARYPDKHSDITRFKVMHDWVVSTIGNVEKFRNEFENYFDLHYSLIYYVYTSVMLMVDQRAKNMFLTYWADTGKWQPWFYDNDTCLGINNEGHLIFDYYHEDIDQLNGEDVYNGQNSTLWSNFRQAYADEIKECYQDLRNNGKLTYEKIIEYFIENGSRKWSASIYNEDSDYKYISMLRTNNDATNLYQIRGNGEGHLKYFAKNRLNYLDSKWYASDYANNYVALRIYTPSEWTGIAPNANITIVPFSNMYAGVRYKANGTLQQERVSANEEITFEAPNETFIDTETAIYGASEISSLGDLAPLYAGSINVSKASKLIYLKAGDATEGYSNPHLTELSVGTNKLLKILDVRNCPNLTAPLGLKDCPNIEEVYATGSGITGIDLPNSGYLKVLHLPDTLINLTLKNQIYVNDLQIAGYDALDTLDIENCPAVDVFEIMENAPNLKRIRLAKVNWQFDTIAELKAIYEAGYKGVDDYGDPVDCANVSGKCHIESLTGAEFAEVKANFPYMTITYTNLTANLIFMSADGTKELCRQTIVNGADGTDPVAAGTISKPTMSNTAQYTFTYKGGWTTVFGGEVAEADALKKVKADRYVYPVFSKTIKCYTVKFYNGTELVQTTLDVPYGSGATYTGETLVYNGTDAEDWGEHIGWTVPTDYITGDTITYAEFKFIGSVTRKLVMRTLSGQYRNDDIATIGNGAFHSCTKLTSVNTPLVTSISHNAFYKCSNLVSVDAPLVTTIGNSAFRNCQKLTNIDLSLVTSISTYAFADCRKLTSVDAPLVTSIGADVFNYCIALSSVNVPLITTIGNNCFYDCQSLTSIDLPLVTSIGTYAFYRCKKLTIVILRSETMCTLNNANAFNSCYHMLGTKDSGANPNGDHDGYIYVPSALIDNYKNDEVWGSSTLQFRAIEDYPDICGGGN